MAAADLKNRASPLAKYFDDEGKIRADVIPEDSPEFVPVLLEGMRTMLDESEEGIAERDVKIAALEDRITKAEESTTARFNAMADKVVDKKPEPVSLSVVARAAWFREELPKGYEREVLVEEEASRSYAERWRGIRDMSTSVDSAGGIIVPERYMPERMISMLDAAAIVRSLGATVISGLTEESIKIPRETGGVTSHWVGEGSAGTETNATLGDLKAQPHEIVTLVDVNDRLMRMSNPSIESFLWNRIAVSQGLLEDLAFLRGTGGENQPLGITNESGILTTSMGATPDEENMRDIIYELKSNNALGGTLGWAMSVALEDYIVRLKDGTGRTLFGSQDLSQGDPQTLLGYKKAATTAIPVNLGATTDRSQMIFGNWMDWLIFEWGGMEFARSSHHDTNFAKRIETLRATRLVDGGAARVESFCSDVTCKIS
jgi:HK97 family phage major capsid protein